MSRQSLRRALVALVAAASLAAPVQAGAVTSVDITTSADPIEDVAFQVTVAGNSDALRNLYAKWKRAGGQPCGVTYAADEGGETFVSGVDVNGAYSVVRNLTLQDTDYLLCAWVQTTSGATAADAATSRAVSVRTPRASGTVRAPALADAGSIFQIAIDTQAEVLRNLYVDVNVPGVPCGANYAANGRFATIIGGRDIVGGPVTHTVNYRAPDVGGAYTVCGYVQETSGDTVPEATFSGQFAVNGTGCLRARTDVRKYRGQASTYSARARRYTKQARRARGGRRAKLLRKARSARRGATRARAKARAAQVEVGRQCIKLPAS
jgi:hypothetical protein